MTDYFGETAVLPTAEPTREELSIQINTLQREVERLGRYVALSNDLQLKIDNVKGYMANIYSEDGEIDDRVRDIAGYLDIPLTKNISGTASIEISWTAQVPIDFDADSIDISFDVDCGSYEADDFDWQTENEEVNGEDA